MSADCWGFYAAIPILQTFLTYLVANDLRWEYESIAFKKQETCRQKPTVGFFTLLYALKRINQNVFNIFSLELDSAKQQMPFDF